MKRFVERRKPTSFTVLCRGRLAGDPLADGTERNVEWGQLPAATPWLPPGGSWIFWQAALRNRLAKKTDEGQRQLKVLNFSVEWYNLERIPLIQLHFLTNRSPPLISHDK